MYVAKIYCNIVLDNIYFCPCVHPEVDTFIDFIMSDVNEGKTLVLKIVSENSKEHKLAIQEKRQMEME